MSDYNTAKKAEGPTKLNTPNIHWDDSAMKTSYANVVNASSTREEVTIFFGTNQTWNMQKDSDVTIQLSDRIIMNPLAAKRLCVLLSGILKEYETKHGPLELKTSNNT